LQLQFGKRGKYECRDLCTLFWYACDTLLNPWGTFGTPSHPSEASIFAFVACQSLDLQRYLRIASSWLFPGATNEGYTQASLRARLGGVGWRQALVVARPANLGALVAVAPMVKEMIADSARAGLVQQEVLIARLDSWVDQVTDAFLEDLDASEREKAEILGARERGGCQRVEPPSQRRWRRRTASP
jgi:hypothetical protein